MKFLILVDTAYVSVQCLQITDVRIVRKHGYPCIIHASVVELTVPVLRSISEHFPVCSRSGICFKYKSSLYILIFFMQEVPHK